MIFFFYYGIIIFLINLFRCGRCVIVIFIFVLCLLSEIFLNLMLFIDNYIKNFLFLFRILKIIWFDYIKKDNFYLKNENF